MPHRVRVLVWLNLLMAVGMSTSVFTGQLKISFEVFSFDLIFPASNLFFAFLTFPVTDVIADVVGSREARQSVLIGFSAQILTMLIVQICLLFPGESETLMPFALGGWKVLLGSTVAYFAAQYWDVWVFDWIKRRFTGEAHLWIRNNVSTFSSQVINSTLFISIVFGWELLPVMLISSIAVKWVVALFDTPFVYGVRAIVKWQLAKDRG